MLNEQLRDNITRTIIDQLEHVDGTWEKPWLAACSPINAVTKKYYRGINRLILAGGEYASYKQWQSIGCQVKKGEKGFPVIFYKLMEKKDDKDQVIDKIPLMRYSTVFNSGQVDGYQPQESQVIPVTDKIEHAESFAKNCNITTRHGGDRAFYSPSDDTVTMPEFTSFLDARYYYSTLYHEYIHATGSKKRLARKLSSRYDRESYAIEELVAELGSTFIMADLKLESAPRADHLQYIKHWLQALRNDNKFIFHASSQAQAAADYLINIQPGRQSLAA